jgi:APA family basic amino acid/polyamine antiporter
MAVVGGIIGSGIFVGPAVVAERVGTAGLTILAWVLGGVIALAGALCFAELGARRPAAGGSYVYLRDAFGPLPAFLYGWMLLFAISTGATAAVAVTFARYVLPLMGLPEEGEVPVAALAIVLLSVVNYIGVRQAAITQNVFTMLKLVALAVVIVVGLTADFPGNVSGDDPPTRGPGGTVIVLGAALVPVLFAYGGWQQTNFIAEEILEPERRLPRALLIGTAIVTAVYVLANVSYLRALAPPGLANSQAPAAEMMFHAAGGLGLKFVSVAIAVSTFGFLNLVILVTPRVYQAMAKDRLFFDRLAKLHPRYRTPAGAIVLQGVWAIALTLTGTYSDLLDYVVFADWIFFGLTAATLFVYRRGPHPLTPSPLRGPDPLTPAPLRGEGQSSGRFRTPGYPWVPGFFVVAAVYVVVSSVVANPKNAAMGIVLLGTGIVVYAAWRRISGGQAGRETLSG